MDLWTLLDIAWTGFWGLSARAFLSRHRGDPQRREELNRCLIEPITFLMGDQVRVGLVHLADDLDPQGLTGRVLLLNGSGRGRERIGVGFRAHVTLEPMLLSVKHRFLFVHIAKTGGTSVRAALEGLRWADPWYWPIFLCSRFSHLSGHRLATKLPRHAKAIAAKEMLPKEFFDQLFKFAFVRNPWDLQVSSFHHIRRERPRYLGGNATFDAFLRWKLDPERPYQYHVDTSIELQSDYLIDLHGRTIVDYIGRYERLHADFATACARIGIKTPALPHAREASDRRKDYRSYYTAETAELVAQHFRADIEMLGYSFDSQD